MAGKYSASSRSSISAALVHWDAVCDRFGWDRIIRTGDPTRGGKLCTFVLELVAHTPYYPSTTIGNYIWALCAHMQQELHADPRDGLVGWPMFVTAVKVMTYVPYEPRTRLPTAALRRALGNVDIADFAMVQMAVLVLFLYFTFQRSEFPCPKTYDGMDPAKHCYVKHMEPHLGGTRWAVGSTKTNPQAERLSADAGPGREWIVIGEVDDDLFDMRLWLQRFFAFFPSGPRDPDSAFFRAHDKVRPLIYQVALADLRKFLEGAVDDPSDYGLHSCRSEGYMTCSSAVSEAAAVIQGGWRSRKGADRYHRLEFGVSQGMAQKMVRFHRGDDAHEYLSDSGASQDEGQTGGGGGLGIVAARAAARDRRAPAPASSGSQARGSGHQPAGLPVGWVRVWHPTKGRQGGYATFEGPGGLKARSLSEVARAAHRPSVRRAPAPPPPVRRAPAQAAVEIGDLESHVTFFDRPATRPLPRRPS